MPVGAKRQFKKLWQTAAMAYLAAIFILSSIPGLTPPPLGLAWQDKFYHFLEYALLSLLLFLAFHSSAREAYRKNAHLLSISVASVYAATDEIHQHFVRNRQGDFWDWVADAVGVVAVQVFIFLIRQIGSSKRMSAD